MKFWKIHSWPASLMRVSSWEIWLVKSSCLLRSRAMQVTTRRIFPRAHRWTLGTHIFHVETSFFQSLLQTFLSTIIYGHLLNLTAMLQSWVVVRNHGIFLTTLFTSVTPVHFKSFESIFRKPTDVSLLPFTMSYWHFALQKFVCFCYFCWFWIIYSGPTARKNFLFFSESYSAWKMLSIALFFVIFLILFRFANFLTVYFSVPQFEGNRLVEINSNGAYYDVPMIK